MGVIVPSGVSTASAASRQMSSRYRPAMSWTASTPLFGLASRVVTYTADRCHAAISRREYGIPCVLSIEGATTHVRDGEPIRLDGVEETVTLFGRG